MAYNWFKFYGADYLSDPKILELHSGQRSCWITLLCYGSNASVRGVVPHLSEYTLMANSGLDPTCDEWEVTVGVLKRFEELGMITIDNGVITIKNWSKRQEVSLTPYERLKKYREKNKKITEVKRDDNARLDKTRLDKNNTLRTKRARVVQKPKKAPVYTALGADVLKAFEEIDPKNKTYYANTTQRAAADFLVAEYGFEKVMKVINLLHQTNKMTYMPIVTSPHDLKERWSKLEAGLVKKKTELTSKGRGVEL